MTVTNYYVNPVGGTDVAGGGTTDGAAYLTVQYAANDIGTTHGRNATDGDQINCKDTGTHTLAAALSLATYGTPSDAAPIFFRGYTSTANDGGRATISGAGSFGMFTSAYSNVYLTDLRLTNTGANPVISLNSGVRITSCEVDTSTSHGIDLGNAGEVQDTVVHDVAGSYAIEVGTGQIKNCTVRDTTSTAALRGGSGTRVINCIASISGAQYGVFVVGNDFEVEGCSLWSNGGTGRGINVNSGYNRLTLVNNIIQGFSGVGGIGINAPSGAKVALYGHNKFYNNTTNTSFTGVLFAVDLGNNDTLSAGAFTDPASDDFSVTTELIATGWPSSFRGTITNNYLDTGAAQREEPASGGLLVHPGMSGGMRG